MSSLHFYHLHSHGHPPLFPVQASIECVNQTITSFASGTYVYSRERRQVRTFTVLNVALDVSVDFCSAVLVCVAACIPLPFQTMT